MPKEKLSRRTIAILDQRRARGYGGGNTMIHTMIPTDTVWYSALDGTIYSIGEDSPKEHPDSRSLTVESDGEGLLPKLVKDHSPEIREIDEAIDGHPEVKYSIHRVIAQIRDYRKLRKLRV